MHKLKERLHKAYDQLDNIFSDKEAWDLFRLSALAETIGWTCLIVGIVFSKFDLPAHGSVLAVGGSIHGILYLFYVAIVVFGHRSMNWSFSRFLFAEAISVVPYGAAVFEIWVSHRRKNGKV